MTATTTGPGRQQPTAVTGFTRRIGLFQATAINMSQIVGVGPFVTIPLMVAAFGGPQAIIGWIAGAVLALADGLIWAELGAAMPGAGGEALPGLRGTYRALRARAGYPWLRPEALWPRAGSRGDATLPRSPLL